MVKCVLFAVDRHARLGRGTPALHPVAAHHRGIVRIGHHRVLGVLLMGVANHAEHAQRLRLPVNGEAGVEDFVPTVFAGQAQRVSARMQHIHMLHGRRLYGRKQGVGSRQTQVQ